jgi:hypothetical protein
MPAADQDLAFLMSGVDQLEEYLLSDELYWPLSGPGRLPLLTIGGLLLAARRLRARELSGADAAQLTGLENRLDVVRAKWRSAWERKCRREVHARLGLWQNYLADTRQSPETLAPDFPQQVQWRVLLHLLLSEFSAPPPEASALEELDTILKEFWLPGGFVWEAELEKAFPQAEFWYLYGKLKV